ncbi:glia maturation factor gamma-like [Bolinopsis microptera]|uniref:glia maturation factor gamma-like n=1 Tax=Bolinopsis microptera TaxID=2820187 RepID=UPI00307A0AFA
MTSSQVCQLSPELAGVARKFRFRKAKNIGAITMKASAKTLTVELEETYEDTTIEDIADDLPTAEPRYLLISYVLNHPDGRVSYPQCFVFYTPPSAKPEMRMLYSSSKPGVEGKIDATKSYELRCSEDLTAEWLEEELSRV